MFKDNRPLSVQMDSAYHAFTLARIDAWTPKVAKLETINTDLLKAVEQMVLTAEQDNLELDFNDILIIGNAILEIIRKEE